MSGVTVWTLTVSHITPTHSSCISHFYNYTNTQVRREQRHVAKWRHMLGASAGDFEAYCAVKLSKVKRRVRKGIPDEFRGYVWQLLSGGCGRW